MRAAWRRYPRHPEWEASAGPLEGARFRVRRAAGTGTSAATSAGCVVRSASPSLVVVVAVVRHDEDIE
jgi:hypothetical protein